MKWRSDPAATRGATVTSADGERLLSGARTLVMRHARAIWNRSSLLASRRPYPTPLKWVLEPHGRIASSDARWPPVTVPPVVGARLVAGTPILDGLVARLGASVPTMQRS